MNRLLNNPLFVIGAALTLFLLSMIFYTVGEREVAIKLFLGEITDEHIEPGLHAKIPLIENVYRFDRRVLTLDVKPTEALTNEKKNVIVDLFVKWRIIDASRFYTSLGGSKDIANSRLGAIVESEVKDAVADQTLSAVVSDNRSQLMSEIQTALVSETATLGVEIVDVRIKKVELPEDVRDSVYSRMAKERATIASEIRSEGREQARIIRAGADRTREETLATAYSQAEQTRGAGDAESARVYAEAYTSDPEFFNLFRSLQAYRKSFNGGNDVMVLRPDSQFFQFFNNSLNPNLADAQAPAPAPTPVAPDTGRQ